MKKIIIFLLMLGCLMSNVYALNGKVLNHHYTYKNFSINLPHIRDLTINDKVENELLMLKFSPGIYWMRDRIYMIDLFYYEQNKNLKVDDIYQNIGKIMQGILQADKQANLQIENCRYKNMLGTKAHQCIGTAKVDGISSVMVGTSLKFPDHKVIINILALEPQSDALSFNWAEYNSFINSIKFASAKS